MRLPLERNVREDFEHFRVGSLGALLAEALSDLLGSHAGVLDVHAATGRPFSKSGCERHSHCRSTVSIDAALMTSDVVPTGKYQISP